LLFYGSPAVLRPERLQDQDPILAALTAINDRLARIERALSAKGAERRFLSYRQAAKVLGVDRAKLGRWVREGRLREVEIDGTARIPMSEVERLERDGLPHHERPRRQRQRKATATSKMTAAEVAAELSKF
jgi:excisionase family DNA binding protein